MRARPSARAALVLAASLAACAEPPDAPRHVRLARLEAAGGRAAPSRRGLRAAEGATPLPGGEGGNPTSLVREDGVTRLETELRRPDWSPAELPSSWQAPVRFTGIGRPEPGRSPQRLAAEGRDFRYLHDPSPDGERGIRPGTFYALGSTVFLFLEPGEEPPERATLAVEANHGRRAGDGVLQVAGRRFSGEGLSVWPGEELSHRAPFPPGSALRLATTAERADASADEAPTVRFRVRLDGELLLEHETEVPRSGSYAWHAVPLPSEGGGNGLFAFEVDGPFAYTAFLDPVVGPLEPEAPAEDGARPDVVLFLADTFRADNLAASGGETPPLAPHLERLAERSLRFPRAWSVSTYTLPAHATLFTGFFPRQLGTVGMSRALPDALDTIAERLVRAGYRTGAITDAGLVSQTFALHQGFQWFDERHADLASTLERARGFLASGDGRPTFLFVHTYRTHSPYLVSEETRRTHGEALGLDFDETNEELFAVLGPTLQDVTLDTPEAREALDKLRRLYRGSVVDLDRGFGELLADLEGRGLLESGYLVFTSDHGESFGEHGEITHRGRVWDVQTRVPLLVAGRGIRGRTVPAAASLVDLAPTIADLAGLSPQPDFLGRSLLSLAEERPAFAFECREDASRSTLCIVDGARKVVTWEDPDVVRRGVAWRAYDLEDDPRERRDLSGSAAWPEELVRRAAPTLEVLLAPRHGAEEIAPSPGEMEALRALGYGGPGG